MCADLTRPRVKCLDRVNGRVASTNSTSWLHCRIYRMYVYGMRLRMYVCIFVHSLWVWTSDAISTRFYVSLSHDRTLKRFPINHYKPDTVFVPINHFPRKILFGTGFSVPTLGIHSGFQWRIGDVMVTVKFGKSLKTRAPFGSVFGTFSVLRSLFICFIDFLGKGFYIFIKLCIWLRRKRKCICEILFDIFTLIFIIYFIFTVIIWKIFFCYFTWHTFFIVITIIQ